jgi:hypothetical protein
MQVSIIFGEKYSDNVSSTLLYHYELGVSKKSFVNPCDDLSDP